MKNILLLIGISFLPLFIVGQTKQSVDKKDELNNKIILPLDTLIKPIPKIGLTMQSKNFLPKIDFSEINEGKQKVKSKKIDCKKIDSLNISLPKKDAKKHGLGIGYGIYYNTKLLNQQKYLADNFLILSYRYLIPLQLTDCISKFIFLNTSQHINFLTFVDKYKKLSHLGSLELGYQRKSNYIFNYYVSIGVANYLYFTSSPIYFINNTDDLDSISNNSSTYFTLRLGKMMKEYNKSHFDFLLLFNTKNNAPRLTVGFNFHLMPYLNFKK